MFLDRKHFFNIFEKIKDFLKRDQRWRRQQWNLFASASDFLHDRGDMEFNREPPERGACIKLVIGFINEQQVKRCASLKVNLCS